MNKAKFITLDNGLTILIYTDNSKSTNHVELYTFFGGNNGEYVDYNGNTRSIRMYSITCMWYWNIIYVKIQ